MKNFSFDPLPLKGLVKVTLTAFLDDRGAFVEVFKSSVFREAGLPHEFVQDNYSVSRKDVLRGLHFQKNPAAQAKLVRCVQGEIYDVAVDIRTGSPTYGKWFGVSLSEQEYSMLLIPEGFAHGFVVRSEVAGVLYKCTKEYSNADERGVRWDDPSIGIDWNCASPIISGKDRVLPVLADADNNF